MALTQPKAQTIGDAAHRAKQLIPWLVPTWKPYLNQLQNQMWDTALTEVKSVAQGNTTIHFYWNPLSAKV